MKTVLGKIKGFFIGLWGRFSALPKIARIISITAACCVLAGLIAFGAWYWFYPTTILGMDASHYQGAISWKAIRQNSGVRFVYLKATEGKTYVDARFKQNWNGAAAAGLKVGAYHFFSTSSTGEDQAKNFIATVPKESGGLPPAIDIEASVTQESDFKQQVADYVKLVQAHYGQKPVFYVSARMFDLLYDQFSNYPVWIINYKTKPNIKGWTLWQYSEKGVLPGVSGYVDLDRYHGSRFAFYFLSF